VLSPDDLAAQLRHPHGEHALAVAESMNRSNGDLNRAAIALLSVTAGEQILEIGPGNAAFAPDLLRAPHSAYVGVDVSAAMVDAGNALLVACGLQDRADVRLGDAHALPLDSGCVDAALAVNTLYFWDELKFAFAELARVLRPGGQLWCVWNSPLRYRPVLERIVGPTRQIARDAKFTVTVSTRR